MRLILIFLTFCTTFHSVAQTTLPNNSIQKYVEEISQYEALKMAALSVYVKDLGSNAVIVNHNGEMSIPSASTMKLFTTATALKILGTAYKFETKLAYAGHIDTINHILQGDLYIIGGGDPTLGSIYYNKPNEQNLFLYEWADTLKAMGIHAINGRVIANGSIYRYQGVPNGWVWSDLGNYYGAGPNGLTIYDNRIQLHFKTKKDFLKLNKKL